MNGNPPGFRRARRPRPVLATVNGQPVKSQTLPFARLADCDGPLWSSYQQAKAAWDRARLEPDAAREQIRIAAIHAYNAWAHSCGVTPIAAPDVWGFN